MINTTPGTEGKLRAGGTATHPAIDARYPVTGDCVGNLRIAGVIASGGMAHVYRGEHIELEVVRAVKLLKPGFTEDNRLRFQTEAKLAANLHHPNIVQIHNVGLWEERLPFIEMEYVPGNSLFDLISGSGALPLAVALAITRIVCDALAFAAQQSFTVYGKSYKGLVHRDIKPGNILIHTNGTVKLTDFGIALPEGISIHTTSPGMLGTFPYASPEQLGSSTLDCRTDVYSLGCVLYEMVTGEKAFAQKALPELIRSKEDPRYRPPKLPAGGVNNLVAELIVKSLMVDREKRFKDAESFGLAIAGALEQITDSDHVHIAREWFVNRDDFVTKSRAPVCKKEGVVKGLLPYLLSLIALGIPMLGVIWAYNHFFVTSLHEKPLAQTSTGARRDPLVADSNAAQSDSTVYIRLAAPHAVSPRLVSGSANERTSEPAEPSTGTSRRDHAAEGSDAFSRREFGAAVPLLEKALLGGTIVSADSTRIVLQLFESYLETKQFMLARQIAEMPVRDGYFEVLKGRLYLQKDLYASADSCFDRAFGLRSVLGVVALDKAAYYKARALDALCAQHPVIENRQRASRAWQSFISRVCGAQSSTAECRLARERIDVLRIQP